MFSIDDELHEFCESGVAVLIGWVDATGHPRVSYAWGPRVHPDARTVSVYVERERCTSLVEVAATRPQIAVTFTEPVSARSIQMKGPLLDTGEPTEAERAWVTRQRDAMTVSTSLIGDPPHIIRNLWMDDVIRIDFEVERAFDQTPGPNAGRPLVAGGVA